MKTSLTSFAGRSFLIITDGDKEHIRNNQPCYGELRKYESTHPGECTQSIDIRPGDLRAPFPAGTPTGFYFDFSPRTTSGKRDERSNKLFEAFFNEESPWFAGFKDYLFERDNNNIIIGVHLPRADVDPTVLVNLLRNVRTNLGEARLVEFIKMISLGLTNNEALAVLCNNGGLAIERGVGNPYYYDNPKIFSARRFFQQTPNDLSGGFLSQRVDYNRKLMQDVFLGTAETGGISWNKHMTDHGLPAYGTKVLEMKDVVSKLKDAFAHAIDNEQAPEVVPYVWKTTSGKTNSVEAA
jgi:hypothetical protein